MNWDLRPTKLIGVGRQYIMDEEKFKKMISSLGLVVLTGDLDTRLRYLGVLISHLEQWIETEKISKDRDAILNVRSNLVKAFNYLISATNKNLKDEQENDIRSHFREFGIVLDQSWGDPRAIYGAQCLAEIESLHKARKRYTQAVGAYSEALRGKSDGVTEATIYCDQIIQIVFSICYNNNLIDISEKEFMKNISLKPTQP
jgi:hypothetical protein